VSGDDRGAGANLDDDVRALLAYLLATQRLDDPEELSRLHV
jgi:hypothetical protein